MKHRTLIITLLLISAFTFSSCKKYPEGPGFTIRGKVDRLANEWVIHKVFTNTVDVTSIWNTTYPDYRMTIKKDYVFELLRNGITTTGTWALDEEKEEIIFQETGSPTSDIFQIYRLKHAELWLYRVVGTDQTEIHLMPRED